MKLIENDSQYEKCRLFLINTSSLLDDPLADEESKQLKSDIYDRTVQLMQYYQRGVMAQQSKAMKLFYEKHGIKYQTFGE